MTDDERVTARAVHSHEDLKDEIPMADLLLKKQQGFWETPEAVVIFVATTAAIFSALAGFAGYKLGSQPPQTINVHLDAPPLMVAPAAKP